MSKTVDQVLADARELSEKDRAALVEKLLDDLDGPVDPSVEDAWIEEIRHRIAADDRGELETMSIEEVKESLRSRKRP